MIIVDLGELISYTEDLIESLFFILKIKSFEILMLR